MKLIFFGTGGGRVVVDRQLLGTGGFGIGLDGWSMHVDPGPGAFLKSIQAKHDFRKTDGIFVSHAHLDHYNDLQIMLEAMTLGYKKKGFMIGSETVINGKGKFEKIMFDYFKSLVETCSSLKPGECFEWKNAVIEAKKTVHEDPTAIGFVLKMDSKPVLGYTSDTEVFDGLAKQFDGCMHLIVNCLRPDDDKFPFHLCIDEAAEIINSVKKKPRTLFILHMGLKFLQAGKEEQRKKLEDLTGVRTVIPIEGEEIELSEKKLAEFI
ncbi:MBL fold metallo-hydrolase [Candidatus Micrarchaeota archaeon]|nr:MBL fold metallo-hydrolase [Candidatus Micrarchaeota archaeon]